MSTAVTLKDVAAEANVHPGTASRALHPATRHMVRPGTAGSMTPPLTTLRLPQYHLGTQAAELPLERIADPGSPPAARLLPPELIIRGSTARPRFTRRD